MKILYPEKYQENAPKSEDVDFDNIVNFHIGNNLSGFLDTVVIVVEHCVNVHYLNFESWIEGRANTIYVKTLVDCRYHSDNLKFLIEKFRKIEEVWNEG
jgi:hypothetical protein